MHFSRIAKIAERQFRQLDRVVTRVLRAFAHMPRSRRRWVAIAMDAIIGDVAVWGALFLRTGDPFWGWRPYLIMTVTGLSIWFLIAVPRKTYMTLLRFAGGGMWMGRGVLDVL